MQFPRLFWWLIATLLLLVVIAMLAPQQLTVSVYKLSLVTMAGGVGYWLDRSLFPYARPDSFISDADGPACDIDLETGGDCIEVPWDSEDTALALLFGIAMLRRALIVGAAMLAIGLGA